MPVILNDAEQPDFVVNSELNEVVIVDFAELDWVLVGSVVLLFICVPLELRSASI
jgi:hypothetical protein